MAIDWEEIKKEYVTTDVSQRQLAKNYGVSIVALNSHAKAENWMKQREDYKYGKIGGNEDGAFVIDIGEGAKKLKPRQKFQLYSQMATQIPTYNIADPVEVGKRIESYFDSCNKNDIPPSPPGLARWLKVKEETLRSWRLGITRKATHQELIEYAFLLIHEDLVNRMQNGAINPVPGIFLLKNWFGYKDKQELEIKPKNPLGELQNPDELRKRIEGTICEEDFSTVEEGGQNG